jgi:hypothetical protein
MGAFWKKKSQNCQIAIIWKFEGGKMSLFKHWRSKCKSVDSLGDKVYFSQSFFFFGFLEVAG